MDFIYRRNGVGLGGWLFFVVFCLFSVGKGRKSDYFWGKEGKVTTEHILLTLLLVFFPVDEWQRLVVFFFSLYREKIKYLLS